MTREPGRQMRDQEPIRTGGEKDTGLKSILVGEVREMKEHLYNLYDWAILDKYIVKPAR